MEWVEHVRSEHVFRDVDTWRFDVSAGLEVRGFLSNTNDGLLPGVLAVPDTWMTRV